MPGPTAATLGREGPAQLMESESITVTMFHS